MSDLIDRYVHQVGLYVRPHERAEIEAELRSQLYDQLEGRYGAGASPSEVAATLKQLGDPRTLAASYGGEQYLIGPELYPFLLTVLRFGLPLVPTLVVVANLIGAALTPGGADWVSLLFGSLWAAGHMTLIFFAVVVLIFAVLQQAGSAIREAAEAEFDPLALPPVEDVQAVNPVEASVSIAFGTLISIALLYFLQVGGLTLRFNPSDPGAVLPVSLAWMLVWLVTSIGSVALNVGALLRRRWTFWTWAAQSLLDLVGTLPLYMVLLVPIAERLSASAPVLSAQFALERWPAGIILFIVVAIVLVNGSKLIRLWQQGQAARP